MVYRGGRGEARVILMVEVGEGEVARVILMVEVGGVKWRG